MHRPTILHLASCMMPIGLLGLLLVGCDRQPPDHVALGTLERDRVALTATVAEVLVELPVRQGTAVKKGMVLARLDDHVQQARVERAKADVAQAEAKLEKLENGPRPQEIAAARADAAGAEAALREAQITYERNRRLRQSKSVSEAELDKSKALRDAARARLDADNENLAELLAGTRKEEIHEAEAELAAARADLAYQEALLAELTIKATRDGLLDNLPWNVGERVTVGSPVVVMLADGNPIARVYVPEPYRVEIKMGDTLKVKVDGLGQTFDGRVRWISAEPSFTPYYGLNESDRSRLVFVAEVVLPDAAANLPNGVPVQVLMP
jgi:HlyD family secretion protein